MEKIFSKIENVLLHLNYSKNDFKDRQDVIDPKEFIQMAGLTLKKDKTFRPHRHIWKNNPVVKVISQEAWVIIHGSVKVDYFDLDGSYIKNSILNAGDCTITLQGGHNYTSLIDNTLVYEFKTGPYLGQEKDKTFID